ncbi:DUF4386 domain-containing protein [Robertkochia aurantiaca]|uniref:DUF4386 domain-containing protein n=1 Tax=Robertkochia aurantiaca TaxID=2873700 RepID=UPI001CCF7D45|nr:DUF4386 domain-containing protein [Robertkochia sp. 3YJGBD-33]
MKQTSSPPFARIAGISYIIIFLAAIFANFFVLESLIQAPVPTLEDHPMVVRWGIMAFLITAVLDVVVAWGLYELFKDRFLSLLSSCFRLIHAIVMGAAVFALPPVFEAEGAKEILDQITLFNNIWLIGLFFFGIHLILLARVMKKPLFITVLLTLAGIAYITDTTAHFLMENYADYESVFLMLVAIPGVLGEMSLAVWLLIKDGRSDLHK